MVHPPISARAWPALGACLMLAVLAGVSSAAMAQSVSPASTRAATPALSGRATLAWTLKTREDIRWQQVTPSGTLLLSTDAALMGVDIERGQVAWERPELGGLSADSVRWSRDRSSWRRPARDCSLIFDPVTGTRSSTPVSSASRKSSPVAFCHRPGRLLVHGRRSSGPAVVALYDLAPATSAG